MIWQYKQGTRFWTKLQKKERKKHRVQERPSNSYSMVDGLFDKPTYVDIPNCSVDAMKPMDLRQEVANILLSKGMQNRATCYAILGVCLHKHEAQIVSWLSAFVNYFVMKRNDPE